MIRGENLNPLTKLNKELVDKMQKGYSPKKANNLMKNFHKAGGTRKILLAGEENEEAIL